MKNFSATFVTMLHVATVAYLLQTLQHREKLVGKTRKPALHAPNTNSAYLAERETNL